MNKFRNKIMAFVLCAAIAVTGLTGCSKAESNAADKAETDIENKTGKTVYPDEISIVLSDNAITADGQKAGNDHEKAVFLSNDVIYYEDKDAYESGNTYGDGDESDKHTAAEAAATTVVNITQKGTYRLSGKLSQGQIRIDLGDDAENDENAVVTLVFDNADINCDVAPAVLFMNVYECDNNRNAETASAVVDTSAAGANVIIADGSENNISGAYVAKIYKDTPDEKKLWKQDGAFYSYMSMNIDGEKENSGMLNITASNEGLDSELHLTINGGNINIFANNDGINTNEDGVSVTTINGGNIRIVAGLGAEGDGIDSNGWLVINGGTVVATANPAADAGMDSDMGSFINGGTVVALGSTMDWAESDSSQVTMNLQFAQYNESDNAIIVTKKDGTVVFAYDPSEDEIIGSNIRRFMGAIISCPAFALGESYNVYIGGTVNGMENAGIYDTVTGFEDAVQQAYSGTDVMMRPGMGGFDEGKGHAGGFDDEFIEGMEPPEGFEKPEGGPFNPSEFKEFPGNISDPEKFKPDKSGNGEMREKPEGFEPFENFEIPEGFEIPLDENGNPTGFGGEGKFDFNPLSSADASRTVFFMQDKVNNFSGVTDYSAQQ